MSALTQKAKPTEAPAPAVKRPRFPSGMVSLAEHKRRHFLLKAPPGMTQEDARNFDAWAHIAKSFTRHDLVTVLADDESWELECCIEAVRSDGCEVSPRKVYSRKPVKAAATILNEEFRAEWRAGFGYCVIRIADDHPVVAGHHTEALAILEWQRSQPKRVAP